MGGRDGNDLVNYKFLVTLEKEANKQKSLTKSILLQYRLTALLNYIIQRQDSNLVFQKEQRTIQVTLEHILSDFCYLDKQN